ncbi:MAG TPA: hypothetical protein VFE33_08815 [Thermoanaerobaculia bacterium]|nr:hypothetical protein [Thermoanaerobaculia bacterium]
MSCKTLPAVLAVCVLSLPLPSAAAARPHPSPSGVPGAAAAFAGAFADLWQRLIDRVPAGARPRSHRFTTVRGKAGCEMDPDGWLRLPPPPSSNP